MARKSRIREYAKHLGREQAEKPAFSIKERLSKMKEKSKEMNQKPDKAGKEKN